MTILMTLLISILLISVLAIFIVGLSYIIFDNFRKEQAAIYNFDKHFIGL